MKNLTLNCPDLNISTFILEFTNNDFTLNITKDDKTTIVYLGTFEILDDKNLKLNFNDSDMVNYFLKLEIYEDFVDILKYEKLSNILVDSKSYKFNYNDR